MTAPSSAYHNKALKDKTTPHNYLMCKFLSEYTSIGSHFYLDKIAKYKDGSTFYFGGACFVGSENSKFHSSARVGKLFDGIELYTDGGLNTLGDVVSITAITLWLNYTIIEIIFRSAYYVDSTNLSYSIGSGGEITLGTLLQRRSVTKTVTLLSPLGNFATPGDSFIFKAINENSEGSLKKEVILTTRNKIWYAGGAGMNTGNGNVWKLPSPTTPLEDSYLYNATGGLSESYFYLDEFIALDDLPEQGGVPTETIIGYKDEQLGWGTNNKFAEGYYYIYNTLETGIPQYGDSMGMTGKVFHVNSQGEFDYYIEREVAIPFVEVTATVSSATQVEIGATMYIMNNGVKTAFSNNLGSNIVIIGGAAWYGSVTAGGSPSGAKLVGSSFTPSSFSLTIHQGNSIAFPTTCTIDDLLDVPSGEPYIAMDTTSISPTPSSNTYVVRILADQYTY